MRKLLLLAALTLPLTAQQPQVQNGQIVNETATTLQAECSRLESQNGTTWLAYTVPTATRVEWNANQVTYLEDENRGTYNGPRDPGKPPYYALVLLRISDHALSNIRVADPERKLDAGGTRVAYLPAVDPAQSVTFLQATIQHATSERLRDGLIFALSVHQSPAAVPALTQLSAPNQDLSLREKAAFWLSTAHGSEALPILDRYARDDRDERFREKITFDLTLVHQPGAADILIRMAHQDSAPSVRKQAQFWMAEIASQADAKRIATDLSQSAHNDPNEEIRKSAVFGLSRLPNGEGTGKLIQLAQTSRDRAVRKQAVFWLGQSDDPRALDYLTRLVQQ